MNVMFVCCCWYSTRARLLAQRLEEGIDLKQELMEMSYE